MNRAQRITHVTIWGAIGNLLLALFKLIAGWLGHSSAMTADAIHSLSDLVSDVIILVMIKISSKGMDRTHQYGHGKFETLATVAIAIILMLAGGELLASCIHNIREILQGHTIPIPGTIALWAALISIVVKELLYQWTRRVGEKVNSPAMITNAWHHRSDALSSIGSALGIGGAILLGGKWVILDPIVGCIISVFILVVAIKMAIPALHELTEGSLPEETENQIIDLINAVHGVNNVHHLQTRRNGPIIIIGVHIVVDPDMTVSQAHHLTVLAENAIRTRFGNETQISIHIEPSEEAD